MHAYMYVCAYVYVQLPLYLISMYIRAQACVLHPSVYVCAYTCVYACLHTYGFAFYAYIH